jgi:hypothetical protein
MVIVGTGGRGTKIIKKNYPVEEGLQAGTTKQEGNKETLEAEKVLIPKRELKGI